MCSWMWCADILHKRYLLYPLCKTLPSSRRPAVNVCLTASAARCKTAASLSGREKRTKYVVCEMAQNPLEVSMEVPHHRHQITRLGIYLLPHFATHRLPQQGDKGTVGTRWRVGTKEVELVHNLLWFKCCARVAVYTQLNARLIAVWPL